MVELHPCDPERLAPSGLGDGTTEPDPSLRVMVVADDASAEQRRSLLATNPQLSVVTEAADIESGLVHAPVEQPDIIVIQLPLSEIQGQRMLSRLRTKAPDACFMVFTGHDQTELTQLVPSRHSAVDATFRVAAIELGTHQRSAATARRFIEEHLVAWDHADLVADSNLVATELVTNAVRHAGGVNELRIGFRGDVLCIEVFDGGRGTPDPRRPADDEPGGRGLNIVSSIATAWGFEPTLSGKVVWAEIIA